MGSVLFVDLICRAPYSSASLAEAGARIGGAEGSVLRLAEALAGRHAVAIAQHNRAAPERSPAGVRFLGAADASLAAERFDAVVMLRSPGTVRFLSKPQLEARLFLWVHDWHDDPPAGLARLAWQARLELRALLLARWGVSIVAVSETHAANARAYFGRTFLPRRALAVEHVYNAVAPPPASAPGEDASFDRDALIFFSAPWKGLEQVLAAFAEVRRELPELKLLVASPGYEELSAKEADGVVFLGSLPHAKVLQHVRRALCTFYPADKVPETFGLVFAESGAVGTPVLAHPFGAAPELLRPEELVRAGDVPAMVARLRAWRAGARPAVKLNPAFAIEQVAARWERLLFDAPARGSGL